MQKKKSTAEVKDDAQKHAVKTDPAQDLKTIPPEEVEVAVTEEKVSTFQTAPSSNKKRLDYMPSKKMVFVWVGVFVFLITGGIVGFFYLGGSGGADTLGAKTEGEAKLLVKKVGEIAELPADEVPTIATVSDVNALKDQPFFNSAQNGDKLLMYTQSAKAYLYRPSSHKIVTIGPIVGSDTSLSEGQTLGEETTGTPTPTEVVTISNVVILNGTKEKGLAKTAQEELLAKKLPVEVVSVGNSTAPETYAETIVIDLTGKNSKSIEEIAKAVGGKTGKLPEDETAPENAEVLIIAGEDFNND